MEPPESGGGIRRLFRRSKARSTEPAKPATEAPGPRPQRAWEKAGRPWEAKREPPSGLWGTLKPFLMPWIFLAVLWTPVLILVVAVSTEYMWVVLCGLTPLTIAVGLTTLSRVLATLKARRSPEPR